MHPQRDLILCTIFSFYIKARCACLTSRLESLSCEESVHTVLLLLTKCLSLLSERFSLDVWSLKGNLQPIGQFLFTPFKRKFNTVSFFISF